MPREVGLFLKIKVFYSLPFEVPIAALLFTDFVLYFGKVVCVQRDINYIDSFTTPEDGGITDASSLSTINPLINAPAAAIDLADVCVAVVEVVLALILVLRLLRSVRSV